MTLNWVLKDEELTTQREERRIFQPEGTGCTLRCVRKGVSGNRKFHVSEGGGVGPSSFMYFIFSTVMFII